ncbi:MAG: hypothetical protein HY657_03735 [Acidobacteria bacterium]|nr:hypothetical protein [Acidobacteriota bacterium]
MTPRHARVLAFWLLVGVVALPFGLATQAVSATRDDAAPVVPWRVSRLPVVANHHYRMAAKVRPLLLFWIGRDNVGAAHVVWRRSPEGTGFELLIGSDPTLAPRHINRWGYIAEEVRGPEASLLGVMKQSNEQSLEEAKSRVAQEAEEGQYVFKAIQSTATVDKASSAITTVRLTHDFTFREVDAVLDIVEREGAHAKVRRVSLQKDTRPGFLVALTELIHRNVTAYSSPAAHEAARKAIAVPYIYNGTLCDLTLRASDRRRTTEIGSRSYEDVIHARFEARNRVTGKTTEFELSYGASGSLAEIPVHAVYRPRWWLQVELFLDQADRS